MNTELELNGYTANITIHQDTDHGAPWEENDGHGIVSEWTSRDKAPGELVLCSDRSSNRFYDFEGTMKLAKKDGWGIGAEKLAQLEKNLGRKATKGEIIRAAVMCDFNYLRGWANNDWAWQGYTTEIETPDGKTIDGDSCWGFDGTPEGGKYMVEQALDIAKSQIERMILTAEQTEIAACYP